MLPDLCGIAHQKTINVRTNVRTSPLYNHRLRSEMLHDYSGSLTRALSGA
jgi:hypothetical protein